MMITPLKIRCINPIHKFSGEAINAAIAAMSPIMKSGVTVC
jgi:hypothetical protein